MKCIVFVLIIINKYVPLIKNKTLFFINSYSIIMYIIITEQNKKCCQTDNMKYIEDIETYCMY
jgi:hypothetical protein